MRVLWTHNFDVSKTPTAGVFMFLARDAMRGVGVDPQLLFLGNLRDLRSIPRARRLVRRQSDEFDLVHAQFGSACAVSSVGHGVTTLVSLRGSDWTPAYSPRWSGRAHAVLATRMTQVALAKCDGAVVVSERMEREVEQSYPTLPVCVAPDPVNLDVFQPLDRMICRQQLGLPAEREYVLFTSGNRSNPHKRVELAQAAVAFARRTVPDVELLVASGYPHSQMPMLVGAADVALHTSVAEGWPNCIKEALAGEVPFVATDVSDLKDIAAVDSRCRVVEATPEALGDALAGVLNDPSPRQGLRDHLASMTYDSFANKLKVFYEEALGGGL